MSSRDLHKWEPTTNTHAVYKCSKCGDIAFRPHPLPRGGCVTAAPLKCRICGAGLLARHGEQHIKDHIASGWVPSEVQQ